MSARLIVTLREMKRRRLDFVPSWFRQQNDARLVPYKAPLEISEILTLTTTCQLISFNRWSTTLTSDGLKAAKILRILRKLHRNCKSSKGIELPPTSEKVHKCTPKGSIRAISLLIPFFVSSNKFLLKKTSSLISWWPVDKKKYRVETQRWKTKITTL